MKVKEFLEVVPFSLIDGAKIYEMRWNENYQDYHSKFIGKTVGNKKDVEPYLDCELDYFDYETQWGEYYDSSIYIKMPKENIYEGLTAIFVQELFENGLFNIDEIAEKYTLSDKQKNALTNIYSEYFGD